MAETRFFQHLNENDNAFLKVTTLDFIDNMGEMVMYYFKDGSKCSKPYIAPVNADSIEGFEFAEVSDPKNVWKLNKVVPEPDERKTAVGSDGVVYSPPSWEDYTQSSKQRHTRIDIVRKPTKVENYVAPADSDYYFDPSRIAETSKAVEVQSVKKESFDFNDSKINKLKAGSETYNIASTNLQISQPALTYQFMSINNGTLHLDVKKFLENIKNVAIHFNNGEACELSTSDFIENAITPKTEKEVVKEVVKEIKDSDIDLGVDDIQKGLIDNMIDMSNKIEYSIDMEITLNLPPASVYKLIKSVYPEGMASGFVNIIANRMQVKELKSAVAEGLRAFYDEDDFSTEEEVVEPKTTVKKAVRTKKNNA